MNIHENARLTFVRRQELVREMIDHHWSAAVAAEARICSSLTRL